MILQEELKKLGKISRAGEVKTIILPKGQQDATALYDISVNVADRSISFVDGESIYAVHETFGVKEEAEFTVFIAGKYLVVELHWGKLYFKGANGVLYAINDNGSIEYPNVEESKLNWVNEKRVRDYVGFMVANKYNLTEDEEIRAYVNNLAFTVISATDKVATKTENATENTVFRFKVTDYYGDLGLDSFDYAVKEKVQPAKKAEPTYLDDELAKEEKRARKAQKSDLQAELEYRRIKDGEDIVLGEPDLEELGFMEEDIDEEAEEMEEEL